MCSLTKIPFTVVQNLRASRIPNYVLKNSLKGLQCSTLFTSEEFSCSKISRPLKLHISAKKRSSKWKKAFRPPKDISEFGTLAIVWTAFAGLLATFAAPAVFVAGAAGMILIVSALSAITVLLWPLFTFIAVGAAFGLPAVLAKFNFLLFIDRILSLFLAGNILGSLVTTYRDGYQKPSKRVSESKLNWDMTTFLSMMPYVNGFSWVRLILDSEGTVGWTRKSIYIKNFGLYSLPAVPLLFQFIFSPGMSLWTQFFNSGYYSAFLSVVIGAIHLQLEKRRLLLINTQGSREKVEVELSDLDEELILKKSAFEEFDALLQRNPSPRAQGDPEDWSVGDVVNWAQREGFARYATTILDHDVDGSVLVTLTDEELKEELGVKGLGDRKKLRRAINDLRSSKSNGKKYLDNI